MGVALGEQAKMQQHGGKCGSCGVLLGIEVAAVCGNTEFGNWGRFPS